MPENLARRHHFLGWRDAEEKMSKWYGLHMAGRFTSRHSRARSTAPSTIAVFSYSLVGTLVAHCYKGVVTSYYYY